VPTRPGFNSPCRNYLFVDAFCPHQRLIRQIRQAGWQQTFLFADTSTFNLTRVFLLLLRAKVDADAVHAMPLILWIAKLLALEDMPQMPTAVIAHNLRPHHAHSRVRPLSDRAGHGVPECGPAAARVELVVGLVQWRVAAGARVDAGVGVVLVEFAGAGGLGAFFAQDAELLWVVLEGCGMWKCIRGGVPGDSSVCHSPSVFCTG
jgi:hypothetical protein